MESLLKLSRAQSLLLRTAARRADGCVIPPDTLRGGARVKVLTALLQRGWIEPADGGYLLTDAGFAAIGLQRPAPPHAVQPVDTTDDLQLLEGITVRPGTKLAALVVALRRPQGATSLQLMLATGWQPHTVRGAISGMLRKKLVTARRIHLDRRMAAVVGVSCPGACWSASDAAATPRSGWRVASAAA